MQRYKRKCIIKNYLLPFALLCVLQDSFKVYYYNLVSFVIFVSYKGNRKDCKKKLKSS